MWKTLRRKRATICSQAAFSRRRQRSISSRSLGAPAGSGGRRGRWTVTETALLLWLGPLMIVAGVAGGQTPRGSQRSAGLPASVQAVYQKLAEELAALESSSFSRSPARSSNAA
jgi:hypothetical protein